MSLSWKTDAFAPANLSYCDLPTINERLPQLMNCGYQWLIQHKIYNVSIVDDHPGKRIELLVIGYITNKYMPVFMASHQVSDQAMRDLDYCFRHVRHAAYRGNHPIESSSTVCDWVYMLYG